MPGPARRALLAATLLVARAALADAFTPPVLVEKVDAAYPAEALRAGLEGTVGLRFTVETDGSVRDVAVTRPAGHGFDEAAAAAVARFRYQPARDDGKPVRATVDYEYHFALQQKLVASQQPATVRGVVVARGTRLPVANAHVLAVAPGAAEAAAEADTDDKGAFALTGLAPGRYAVVVLGAAITRSSFDENLGAGAVVTVRYAVDQPWSARYTSTVVASPTREEVSRRTMTTQELAKIPGTFGDALRAVENMPGVARAPFNTGLIIVRGGKPTDSREFLAGLEVPQLYHFGGLTSIVPSSLVADIEFLPGNFSARWGRATAGVVDLDLREGKRDGLHGWADVNIIDTGVGVEGPVGRGSFVLAVRRSYIDGILSAIAATGAFKNALSFTTAPVYYDYQAILDHPLAGGKLRVLVIGDDDRLELLLAHPSGDPTLSGAISTHIFFHHLQARWTRQLGPVSFLVENASGFGGQSGGVGETLHIDTSAFSSDSRLEAAWRPTPWLHLTAGLDEQASLGSIDADVPPPPREGVMLAPIGAESRIHATGPTRLFNLAGYVEGVLTVGRLTLSPGLRLDYFSQIDRASFDPRLGARWVVRPGTTLKAGVGQYSQPPTLQDSDPHFGNPDLAAERALHLSLAVEQVVMPGLTLEVTGFYKHLWSLVTPSSALVERDGSIVAETVNNEGSGRIYGGELLLRQMLTRRFFGWVSYTLMRSERRDCDACAWRTFDFDQTHVLVVALHVNLPRGFEAGARFRYVSGLPYTPAHGGFFVAEADEYVAARGDYNAARLGSFNSLDLRVDKTFVFDAWLLKLYLDVMNVYDRANPEQPAYSYDYTKSAPITGLPILPSFGIRGEF